MTMGNLMIKDPLYTWLKWITTVVLPAAGTAYFGLAGIWHWGNADKVAATDIVLCTFLGIVLGISNINYKNSDARFDGTAFVDRLDPTNNPDVMLKDPDFAKAPKQLVLKVAETAPPASAEPVGQADLYQQTPTDDDGAHRKT